MKLVTFVKNMFTHHIPTKLLALALAAVVVIIVNAI